MEGGAVRHLVQLNHGEGHLCLLEHGLCLGAVRAVGFREDHDLVSFDHFVDGFGAVEFHLRLHIQSLHFFTSDRIASNRHQIDAVPVSFEIWEVVTEVRAVNTNSLTISQTPDIFPDDFLVTE